MKYIRLVLILLLMLGLFGFANSINNKRKLGDIKINFNNNAALFVTAESVENLLIDNLKDSLNSYKYMLDLKGLEHLLNKHDMIKSADIFSDIKGNLGVIISQRQPIARFFDGDFNYIDEQGLLMPLSHQFSARVPLVYGFSSEEISTIYPLLLKIRKDEFLKKHIIAIRKNSKNQTIKLNVRNQDFSINLGKIEALELKFTNYKAFYLKAKEEQKLNDYKSVNLQFGNQVVCTFKQ